LQGQITADLANMEQQTCQFAAIASLKGRVVASFVVVKVATTKYILLTDESVKENLLLQLQKVAPLLRVSIADISSSYCVYAVFDKRTLQDSMSIASLPETHNTITNVDNNITINYKPHASCTNCWLILASVNPPSLLKNNLLQNSDYKNSSFMQWLISNGMAWINASNSDKFLPQQLNMHFYKALSFTKGCYLGQEVIARAYYRGKTKKVLAKLELDNLNIASLDGANIIINNQDIGLIVNAYSNAEEASALAVMQLDWLDNLDNKQTHSVTINDHACNISNMRVLSSATDYEK
jgi:folate-binding protein YgfZ